MDDAVGPLAKTNVDLKFVVEVEVEEIKFHVPVGRTRG